MVNEYIQQCGYTIGKLKDYVYLVPDATPMDYTIDNNQIYVNSILSSVIKLNGKNVILIEEQSLNNRFQFQSTVNITLNELSNEPLLNVLHILRNGKWKIIVENKEGTLFIQSVDFSATLTYDYTINDDSTTTNNCVLTFTALSNIPVMECVTEVGESVEYLASCEYNNSIIKSFQLSNFKNTLVETTNGNDVSFDNIILNGGETMKDIEFNPTSFSFNENYSNNNFTNTITFTIPLSHYKYIWHYNLIEFKNNRYISLFKTSKDNYIVSGQEFGYVPSFVIQTSEDEASQDTITITLTHMGDFPLLYSSNDDPIEENDDVIYVPVPDATNPSGGFMSTEMCIDNTQAIRTLLQETTITGAPLNRYWCLEGYETIYAHYNIVGTYTLSSDMGLPLTINSSKCYQQNTCQFTTSIPTSYQFTTNYETQQMNVYSTCDWNISNAPSWLTIDTMNGLANTHYVINMTTNSEPIEEGQSGYIQLVSGDNIKNITVNYNGLQSWLSPTLFYVERIASSVDSFLTGLTSSQVTILDSDNTSIILFNNVIRMIYAAHQDEYNVVVQNNLTGEIETIRIIVGQIYENWVTDYTKYICVDGNSYYLQTRYIGYSPTTINQKTDETRAGELKEENDSNCVATSNRWVLYDNAFTCDGDNKWSIQKEQASTDGGTTWTDTGNTRLFELVEANSTYCTNPDYPTLYKWVIRYDLYSCNGVNSYYQEQQYESRDNGVTYFPTTPSVYRDSSTLKQSNDRNCGYNPPVEPIYRWIVDGNNYICVEEDKIYRWVNIDITEDWECVDVSKHYKQKEQVSIDNEDTWTDTGNTRVGDLYLPYSMDCGFVPPSDKIMITIYSNIAQIELSPDYVATIDWGDGTVESGNLLKRIHGYPMRGFYTITLTGTFTRWDLVNTSIVSVDSWGNSSMGYTYFFLGRQSGYVSGDLMEKRSIINVVPDLYGGLSNVTSLNHLFYQADKLTSVPTTLFDNAINVTNFEYAFYNCISLTGTTPNTNGLELWERAGTAGYPINISGNHCFYNCTKLNNYDLIDDNWKNYG